MLGVIYLHTDGTFSKTDLPLLTAICEVASISEHFDPETAYLRLPSVFISYSRQNLDFVSKFAADLRRQRVAVWLDPGLHGSKDWKKQVAQLIQQANAFALVMSPDSLKATHVQWEIDHARTAGKPIFPLWHQPCKDVHPDIARLQRIDLLADYQAGTLELVDELYELSSEAMHQQLMAEPFVRSLEKREKTRILFLAANPRDTNYLYLGEEIRTIEERIRGGEYRDQFEIVPSGWAVRFNDLQRYLLKHKPHIIHFSGHGGKDGQLMLVDNSGNAQLVTKKTLSLLFRALRLSYTASSVQLVVLNACFSVVQAEAIAQEVGCVVGMTRAVSDTAAIEFGGAFYQALTFGESVQVAFNLAASAMSLTSEEEIAQLLTEKVNAHSLIFCIKDDL